MSNLVAICEAYAGAATPKLPIDVAAAGNRFAAGQPVEADVERVGTTNTPTLYGADLPHPYLSDDAWLSKGDGSTTVFDTTMTYAAFSNYNWIVKVNGTILEQGAGAGKYQVSDNTVARVTFGTAPTAGAKIEVYLVTPVAVFAPTAQHASDEIRAYDVMWVNLAGSSSATNIYLRPLTP